MGKEGGFKIKLGKETPISEITLRRYEKPYDINGRDLVKKFCLSLGILQPGDSRDIIVDVLYVVLSDSKSGAVLHSEEIRSRVIEFRKENKMSKTGTASSNIRRQIKRLREIHLVEKIKNRYRVTEKESMRDIFVSRIDKYIIDTVRERLLEYADKVDDEFGLGRHDPSEGQ